MSVVPSRPLCRRPGARLIVDRSAGSHRGQIRWVTSWARHLGLDILEGTKYGGGGGNQVRGGEPPGSRSVSVSGSIDGPSSEPDAGESVLAMPGSRPGRLRGASRTGPQRG